MEPRDRAAQEVRPGRTAVRGCRLGAACVLLVGLAIAQSPGLLVADTKLDLAVGPAGFLARATHLWDAVAAVGPAAEPGLRLPAGPMGPFFAARLAARRARLGGAAAVARAGAVRRVPRGRSAGARTRGPLGPGARAGGFAYALSPRMLTTLGPISVEAWPGALAPWVLLPLVDGLGGARRDVRRPCPPLAVAHGRRGQRRGHFRRHPARGAVAAHAEPGSPASAPDALVAARSRCWARCGGWCRCSSLGAYSPPFLDCIESASNTTFSTTLFDSLRGTSNWVPYVDPGSRAGNDLIRLFYLPIDSGVVLLLGLVGLLHRRNPHRGFLSLGVLLGMLMVSAGHSDLCRGGVRRVCRTCSTGCSRRCETCTSSTPCSGCRWCWGSGGWSTTPRAGSPRSGEARATSTSWPDGYGFGRCWVSRRWRCWGRRCPPSPGT